jgi:hypothetical protein
MREIMNMVERLEKPRVGPYVPDTLYFPTCRRVWETMQPENMLVGPEGSMVFTTDWHGACKSANKFANKHECNQPLVIIFNGDDLARKFNIVPVNATDSLHSEANWTFDGSSIDQVDRYISAIEPAYIA